MTDQDASGDQPPADNAAPADDERIQELAERIDKARGDAEDAGILVDQDEETFVDSGTADAQDDQTIVPPG